MRKQNKEKRKERFNCSRDANEVIRKERRERMIPNEVKRKERKKG